MSASLRFFLILFLSFLSFTAGWFLRDFYSPVEGEQVMKQAYISSLPRLKTIPPSLPPVQKEVKRVPPSKIKKKVSKTPVKEDKYKKINLLQILKLKGNVFSIKGEYSFLVNGFSKEEDALNYIKKIKNYFPSWSIFIKEHSKFFKVYLGPFRTKKEANLFIKNLNTSPPFPNYFLEKQGL